MIAAAARKLTSTMPSAIAALGDAVPAADQPATSTTSGATMRPCLHDVERDLAFDERDYWLLCSHGFPSSSRAIWAMYV